ncbi:hypothetical protein [Brachyspira hyodysenteriae]|uniref:hypothetical protein n=1 Tax=Brachyspira hyodysenteriae TaxID=159 RepID=UPI0022CE243A|nr:hypothetical protein [Brachyspira hyodysenteriae]MCZ9988235.1 hypothetical protein [Brachyspira hyodysenteriae]
MNKEYDMQNINYITAGELKELLKEVPDNYELLVKLNDDYPCHIKNIGYRKNVYLEKFNMKGGDLIFVSRKIKKKKNSKKKKKKKKKHNQIYAFLLQKNL